MTLVHKVGETNDWGVQLKVVGAVNAATGKEYSVSDLFNYRGL